MKGRNAQVSRILSILDLFDGNPSGLTVNEVHQKLKERGHQAERRTVYRDIEALSQAGFPLFADSGANESGIRWRLERTTRINQYLALTTRELFALFLSRGALKPLSGTPFFEDLQSIFKKLEEKLGDKQRDYLDELSQDLKFEPGPQWGLGLSPEVLDTVQAACSEGHLLSLTYSSASSKTERKRTLGPHYLYYSKGGLYLVAEDMEQKKVKVFALPRISNAVMLEDAYSGSVVTPEDFFDGSFGVFAGTKIESVEIEFEADVAPYVRERRWHQSQKTTGLENGRIRVQLEISDSPELHSWILGFGPSARVIAPSTLAEKVAIRAIETAERYKRKIG